MVVIDHDGDIRLDLFQPVFDGLIRIEERFPVRFLGAALVVDDTDGRDVRRADTGDDFSHFSDPLLCARGIARR